VAGDARSWSQAEQERVRRLAVGAVLGQGMSVVAAGRLFGVSRQTVSGWVNGFRREGEAALGAGRRGRRAGEQQALPLWMQGQLVQTIRGHNPDQLRLPFFLWTREAVRELIRRRYGIELATTTVGQYLRRWGFTPQKPVQRAFEQNPVAVARWLEREYPTIKARAKREGARVLWGDEMGLRSDQAAGRSYAPRGRTPVVGKAGSRFGCNVIQAISNRGELCFRVFEGRFTQTVYLDFLKRLLKHAHGRKIHLIVDGHPAHRGAKVKNWLAEQAELIEVHQLPGYSPELNPAELLNNDTKHAALTRRRPRDPDELLDSTRSHLHRRQKQPHLIRRFFQHPDVAYAA
jgi:transposase